MVITLDCNLIFACVFPWLLLRYAMLGTDQICLNIDPHLQTLVTDCMPQIAHVQTPNDLHRTKRLSPAIAPGPHLFKGFLVWALNRVQLVRTPAGPTGHVYGQQQGYFCFLTRLRPSSSRHQHLKHHVLKVLTLVPISVFNVVKSP